MDRQVFWQINYLYASKINLMNKNNMLIDLNRKTITFTAWEKVVNYKLPRGCVDLKTGKNLEPKGLTASWYNDLADKGLQLSFCRKIYN